MSIRLLSSDVSGIEQDTERLTAIIGETAQRYGFSLVPRKPRSAGADVYIIPGYTGGAWPGQPDVDWYRGTSWKLVLDRPHDLPDEIECSVFPPRAGYIAKVLMSVTYASKMPVEARPLWQDMTRNVLARYGRSALLEREDLK